MVFKEVSTNLAFSKREKQIIEFWRENKIFHKSTYNREGHPPFVFFEGPPTANGMPTIAHAITRTMKDLVCRYRTMTGHYVFRKAGWDTHGLPVEIEVEKELGISGKDQIEEYGIEKFNQKCKASVFKYVKEWHDLTERLGYWLDLDNPYITLTNDYMETVWWSLKKYWDAGLLYKAHKVVPYCARCGTPLSSHELSQGYKKVEDPSLFVKLRVLDEENTYFLMWTTTPWTLPSNVALAVKDDYDYVAVEHNGETLIMAHGRLASVFENMPKIVKKMKGRELFGKSYKPLFDFMKSDKKAFYVVTGDFVTLEEGTGIVHIAPAFGQDDYDMSKKYDLPVFQPVDADGNFTSEVTNWAGMFVKDADPDIMKNLEEQGLLFRKELYEHDYPFCWRCDSPLLYYARSSWFIRTTAYKDKMIQENKKINWYPEHIKEGLFGNWLENNVDWAISRNRYWGTPLNMWICTKCNKEQGVGSIEELKRLGKNVPDDIELHRPYVDRIIIPCPDCGADMRRVPEVIDCWYDSGMMHTAQWHYPFENQDIFKQQFPGDFIAEAIDQTRGWFYSLLATSVFLHGQTSYKNCLVTEHVLGPDFRKMSKSKGNRIEPEEILEPYGADALRWYFSISPAWTRRPLSKEAVEEVIKKFMGTLHNVYSFFVLYANIDNMNPAQYEMPISERTVIDKWLISSFNDLVDTVRKNMELYQISVATRAIAEFVDDLSNWYVRRCRDRYWGSETNADKIAAYKTLYEVLVDLSKIIAPFIPFMAEEIYQNLARSVNGKNPESVHLCDYPVSNPELIDKKLEWDMAYVRNLVVLARAARNRVGIKTRQPLAKMIVSARTDEEKQAVERFKDLMVDEINVKSIEFAQDMGQFVTLSMKPVFSMIGKKYGKLVPKIAQALTQADPIKAQAELKNDKKFKLQVNGEMVELLPEEIEISTQDKEGFVTESEKDQFVTLSTEQTEELKQEGFAREIINKVQFTRKQLNFNVVDRIKTEIIATEPVLQAMRNNSDYIKNETLTLDLTYNTITPDNEARASQEDSGFKEWDINGERAFIRIRQVAKA